MSVLHLPESNRFQNQFLSFLLPTFLPFATILFLILFKIAFYASMKGSNNVFLICHSMNLFSDNMCLLTLKKRPSQYCHSSSHVTFHSVLNRSTHISISPRLRGDEGCDWSAFPAGNERASLRGLFKQPVTRLRSCSRTGFHVTGRPALPTQPTWVILPYPVLISEVLLACKCVHVQRNISVIGVC